MNDGALHLALREWRAHITTPATLGAVVGIALILAIIVPFEAGRQFGVMGRFGYWLLVVATTYGAGAFINGGLSIRYRRKLALPVLIGISCAATGAAIAALLSAINSLIIGYLPTVAELPIYLGNIFIIAFIVAAMFHMLSRDRPDTNNALPPAILDRIPYEKRGRLMALSVEDHYVRIITTKGVEFVLLRLSDAMRETGDVAGMQVHRSHWIATQAVKSARRDGDRAILTLVIDTEIPVSRRYVTHIKKAGLLAK